MEPPTNPLCILHEQFSKDVRLLLDTATTNKVHIDEIYRILSELKNAIIQHISEAEREGGIRDRVKKLENEVEAVKAAQKKEIIKVGLIAGFIGALLGHLVPDLGFWIIKFLKIHLGV